MLASLSNIAYLLLLILLVPLPIGTDRRVRSVPWVTYGLIAFNTFIFAMVELSLWANHGSQDIFAAWGVVPRAPALLPLFTSIFLHVNFAHLLWNMVFLWLFGPNGEDALGHLPFLIFYIAGGVAAGLLHMAIVVLFAANTSAALSPLVGASGAVSAVVGLYAVRFYRSRLCLYWISAGFLEKNWGRIEVPALAGLGLWLAQNVFGAVLALFQPDRNSIAYWAHIGGFVFGMVAAEFTDMLGEGMREYLLIEAGSASERGEPGLTEAVRKYRILLQRRPMDTDARGGLAQLSGFAAEQASEASEDGRQAVANAYVTLIETALVDDDVKQAAQWREEMQRVGAEERLDARTLMRLAGRYARSREDGEASRLYARVARLPRAPEATRAAFEAAQLDLGELNQPGEAARLLLETLERPQRTRLARPYRVARATWRRAGKRLVLRLRTLNGPGDRS